MRIIEKWKWKSSKILLTIGNINLAVLNDNSKLLFSSGHTFSCGFFSKLNNENNSCKSFFSDIYQIISSHLLKLIF